jgi:plasmid maintenance system antidote protein VapI
VSAFLRILEDITAAQPFNGSQRALARAIDINHAHLSRVLTGERDFSPQVVGRVAKLLPEKRANELIKAYLQEIANEIAEQQEREAVKVR